MSERPKQFYASLTFATRAGKTFSLQRYFTSPHRPGDAELFDLFKAEAEAGFARYGFDDTTPAEIRYRSVFEMPEPPRPLPEDTRPLLPWKVGVGFVCHDIKFADETTGVFQWPDRPAGATLLAMAQVLIAESLSMRNEPDWTDMCEVRSLTAEPTTDKPDHPLDQ